MVGTLIKCYSNTQLNSFEVAFRAFDQVEKPNVFVYNSVIRASVDNKRYSESVSTYGGMLGSGTRPNRYTYTPLLKACALLVGRKEGLQIHGQLIKHGIGGNKRIKSALIHMYVSFGEIEYAHNVLNDGGGELDTVCWNAMIDGYMKSGNLELARKVFDKMPNRNIGTWNAMISGFSENGMIGMAREYFDRMLKKDEISWSAMIDGYNRGEFYNEALEIFGEMQRENIRLSKFVLSSVLASCANVGGLHQGKWIHTYIEKNSIILDDVLGTSLVDMYAHCGCIELALEVFEKLPKREVFPWNAMIGGLAIHGRPHDAIELFSKLQSCRIRPNCITFVGILNACAHGELVDKGLEIFHSMKQIYGVEPKIEHYGCVVDLLGRVGALDEAEKIINSMPMKPNSAVWGALLGACRKHGNAEMGERLGRILLELEPKNSGRYALLSNIYAKAGRWDEVGKLRKLMKERGVKTKTGNSIFDLDGSIHIFKVGEGSHPQMKEIYIMLEKVIERLKLEGYVPNTSQVLFDIEEEEKETELGYHSEKLAIAFGLLNTKPGETIRIVKNLRVCDDCHAATKLISRIFSREIIVRDRARYHHFRDGTCTCNDYW